MPLPPGVEAVLTDIEGTTTSISFVYDVLFPYAKERLDACCSRPGPRARSRRGEEWREAVETSQVLNDIICSPRGLRDVSG